MDNLYSTTGKSPAFIKRSAYQRKPTGRKLVVIQLNGGNDGLNTIIPFRNDIYYRNRPVLGIKKNKTINIDGDVGFNENLTNFAKLYDAGYVSIINRVGYPNASRSHFKSMDFWNAGGDFKSGWLGRYLDNLALDDIALHAVEVSDILSLALRGEYKKGVAFDDLEELHDSISNPLIHQAIKLASGHLQSKNENLEYIYQVLADSKNVIDPAVEKFKRISNMNEFPDTSLGRQLRTVARMIISGIDTSIYYTSLGTFDTHVGQQAKHNKLLSQLSEAVYSFVMALKKHGRFEEICILIFSEFGRRVKENASKGTDHGSGNSMFVINSNLSTPGFYNAYDTLEQLVRGDLPFEIDFRQLYAAVLEDWMSADSGVVLGKNYDKLNLFSQANLLT